MARLGGRWKLWRLMAAVAVAAVLCAAVRSERSPIAGLAIVGACVFVLACKRYTEALTLRRSEESPTTRPRKARLFLASSAVAATIVGLSDLAFLAGYYFWPYLPAFFLNHTGGVRWSGLVEVASSAVAGAGLALIVASTLRHSLWPLGLAASERRRRFLEWKPGVIVACITLFIGALILCECADWVMDSIQYDFGA